MLKRENTVECDREMLIKANEYVVKLYTDTAFRLYKEYDSSNNCLYPTEMDISLLKIKNNKGISVFTTDMLGYIKHRLVHTWHRTTNDSKEIYYVSKLNYCLQAFNILADFYNNNDKYVERLNKSVKHSEFLEDLITNIYEGSLHYIDLKLLYIDTIIKFVIKNKLAFLDYLKDKDAKQEVKTLLNTEENTDVSIYNLYLERLIERLGKEQGDIVEKIQGYDFDSFISITEKTYKFIQILYKMYERLNEDKSFLDFIFDYVIKQIPTAKGCIFVSYRKLYYVQGQKIEIVGYDNKTLVLESKKAKVTDFTKQFGVGVFCIEYNGKSLPFINNIKGFAGEFVKEADLDGNYKIQGYPVRLSTKYGTKDFYFIKSLRYKELVNQINSTNYNLDSTTYQILDKNNKKYTEVKKNYTNRKIELVEYELIPLFTEVEDIHYEKSGIKTTSSTVSSKFEKLLNTIIANNTADGVLPTEIEKQYQIINLKEYDEFLKYALFELYKKYGHTDFILNRYK